jgi:hypothetical protein
MPMKKTGWCRVKLVKILKNSLTKFDQYIVLSSHFSFLHTAIGGSAMHTTNRISFLKCVFTLGWKSKRNSCHEGGGNQILLLDIFPEEPCQVYWKAFL